MQMSTPFELSQPFNAIRTNIQDGQVLSKLEQLSIQDLTPGEVIIRNRWAGVNFKDCLSLHGKAKIITTFPRIAGIELAGEVIHSESADFRAGQSVFVHGFQTGIQFDGGFSEFVRVPAAHLHALPEGLSHHEAATLGVPAFSVAMALERFELEGIRPSHGPVAVSGAGGAVSLAALGILSRAGYEVVAITRRMQQADSLRAAGAKEVMDANAILAASPRALEKPLFAAAIDNVGGPMLSWLLRSVRDHGCVASVGNASSNSFDGSVLPFIMRSIKLVGIVANAPWDQRKRLWARLASDWKPNFELMKPHVHHISLNELIPFSLKQLEGQNSGRTLISFD
jgi:putative YhdH/YhfP family quinone oxidoreductase